MLPTAIALTGEPASPAITESSFDFEGNNTASKVLLIDLENCPNQIQHIHENLAAFTRVVICYAQSTAKIPLDWLLPLNQTINQGRLKVIQMTTKGKNSADFGIAFFAGSLMNEMPPHTEFVILSDEQKKTLAEKYYFEEMEREKEGTIVRFCTSWATKQEGLMHWF